MEKRIMNERRIMDETFESKLPTVLKQKNLKCKAGIIIVWYNSNTMMRGWYHYSDKNTGTTAIS